MCEAAGFPDLFEIKTLFLNVYKSSLTFVFRPLTGIVAAGILSLITQFYIGQLSLW